MWWLILACVTEDLVKDPNGSDDTGSLIDTDVPETPDPESWPDLQQSASWVSEDVGYATGAGFADVDGDGDADLVVANGNDMDPGYLVVYENDGGSLESWPSWQSAHPHFYGHLSLGDVNGDGLVDVAVSRFLGDAGFGEPGGVQVFLNRDGEFETTPSWETNGFFSFSCALGDMDGDGDLDLAVAVGEAYRNDPDRSLVFENQGDGNFGSASVWSTETDRHSFDVTWADLDQDGRLDLAFANQETGHTVYRNEDGMLGEAPWWEAGASDGGFEGNTIDWGDVDGDGHLDLVISDNDQLGGVGAVRVWCGPDFAVCWETDVHYASAVSLEDFDGDGDLDLALGGWWTALEIFENEGGDLGSSPVWSSSMDDIVVEALSWADIDGSHDTVNSLTGDGLLMVPGRGRVLSVTGGVAAGGWVTGPGSIEVTYLEPRARDLLVSDWTETSGNRLYERVP